MRIGGYGTGIEGSGIGEGGIFGDGRRIEKLLLLLLLLIPSVLAVLAGRLGRVGFGSLDERVRNGGVAAAENLEGEFFAGGSQRHRKKKPRNRRVRVVNGGELGI